MLPIGIATLVVSLGVTVLVTPWVVRLARIVGALDLPGGRKQHAGPIPRIGGVAVFAGFIAGLIYAAGVTGTLFSVPAAGTVWRALGVATAAMFAVGLWDDLRALSFRTKLLVQLLASLLVWHFGFRIEVLSHPFGGAIALGALALPMTVLWIVGITNAVNLLDGLDGLAAGTAIIMTSAIGVIAFVRGDLGVTAVSVALVGSLIGFLWFNFNPARIFLGDSGTMFIGFVLAVACVAGNQKGPAAIAILAPLLVLGLPLLDTSFAILRRLARIGSDGRRSPGSTASYVVRNLHHVFLPDRGHIHHRLIDLGLSHRNAVLVLYGVAALTAGAAFAVVLLNNLWVALSLLALLVLLMAVFFVLVRRRQPLASAAPADAGAVESRPDLRGRDRLGHVSET